MINQGSVENEYVGCLLLVCKLETNKAQETKIKGNLIVFRALPSLLSLSLPLFVFVIVFIVLVQCAGFTEYVCSVSAQ